jgi:uncharacterized protein (DUF305 family)
MRTHRYPVLVATAGLAFGVVGCTVADPYSGPGMMGNRESSWSGVVTADHADVMFSAMMVPHHAQAVEMSRLVPGRSLDPRLGDLAARIEAAQGPEIVEMEGWLRQWGAAPMPAFSGRMMPGMGMVSSADLGALETLSGVEFDRRWLAMMVVHHQGAIVMAWNVLAAGRHAPTASLARRIVVTQQQEIDEMRMMLGS